MSARNLRNRLLVTLAVVSVLSFAAYLVGVTSLAAKGSDRYKNGESSMVIHGTLYDDSEHSKLAYVLVEEGEQSVSGSGDTDDYTFARKLRDRYQGDYLFVRQGTKRYVVRDHDAVEQTRSLMDPMRTVGKRQAEVGGHQAEIGARQAVVGTDQAKLGARQSRIGARQAQLTAKIMEAAADGRSARDYRDEMADLSQEMQTLGSQQERLGRKIEALSREMEPFAREQARLGARQARLQQRLQEFMEDSIPDWIRDGRAERLD